MFDFLRLKREIIFHPTVPGVDILTPIEKVVDIPPFSGYILSLWTDIFFSLHGTNIIFKASCNAFEFDILDKSSIDKKYAIYNSIKYLKFIKAKTPWLIKSNKKGQFIILPPFHTENEYVSILPKIVSQTDNLDIIIYAKKEGDYVIEKGTPLAIILPIKTGLKFKIKEFPFEKNIESWRYKK